MRYGWPLVDDQRIKSNKGIGKTYIEFLIRGIIIDLGTTEYGQIRKSILLSKSCDTLCLKIKAGNTGIGGNPEFITNNDEG